MSSKCGTQPHNVARAVVIKEEDIFFLSERDGSVPAGNQDGFGLYYHDCRYLDRYEVQIAGTPSNALASTADQGSVAQFELTNESFHTPAGKSVSEQTFGISLQRMIDSKQLTVHDEWTVNNYDIAEHRLPLTFRFDSGFEDVFEIRGLHPKKVGKPNKPHWENNVLVLSEQGADGVNRRLEVHLDPKPDKTSDCCAEFTLDVKAHSCTRIVISLRVVESKEKPAAPSRKTSDTAGVASASAKQGQDWLSGHARIQSDYAILNRTMHRCLLDLLVLRGTLDNCHYFAAGLPWYGTLFGRDSIIAALETLAYESSIAEQTIRLLAKYQGSKNDDWRDEQPGKILHELRRGELANLNEIPQTPYYGSVDSTPLFLILVGEHAKWTGSLKLFNELRSNVERALHWIDTYGDEGGNGYLSYASKSSKGLGNQGWKDSGNAIMNADGSLATPPIALVEVQGYVYRAKLLIADLYARSGDSANASRLRKQAEDFKVRFNHDFWLEDKHFYALALQRDNRPAAVISSNPGQALWSGIIDQSRAAAVVHRLLADDMFSGWGIRTLSTKERRANPVGYHLGTVWPHDNAIIAAGFCRYGFDDEAAKVLEGVVAAAPHFHNHRLPEVFAGYSRQRFAVPVRYPVACHPQAWAAGSVPFMLTSLLGIVPDALNNRLRIVRPVLPANVDDLDFSNIKVGNASVDLRFHRKGDCTAEAEVIHQTGNLDVQVEPEARPKAA